MSWTFNNKRTAFIILGLFILAVLGAQITDSPVKAPRELVGNYEQIENFPAAKSIYKLDFSEAGYFESKTRLISYDLPPPGNDVEIVWKGYIRKIETDNKTVRVLVKITSADGTSDAVGRTIEYFYDQPSNKPLITIYESGFTDKLNEIARGYRHLGVSMAPQASTQPVTQTNPSTPNIAGKYSLQTSASSGEMIIEAGAGGAYGVSINVTTDSGCGAEIRQVMGTVKDNGMLWATKLNDDGKTQCALEIKFDQQSAIVSESGCIAFHGVACGFVGTYTKNPQ